MVKGAYGLPPHMLESDWVGVEVPASQRASSPLQVQRVLTWEELPLVGLLVLQILTRHCRRDLQLISHGAKRSESRLTPVQISVDVGH